MKRCFDILVSTMALLVLAAPILFLMALVRLTSQGPALYWSDRVGHNGNIFNMPKLRTMAVHTPVLPTHELQDAECYITTLGKILRYVLVDIEVPMLAFISSMLNLACLLPIPV